MSQLFDAYGTPIRGEKLPSGLDVFYQLPMFDGLTTWNTTSAKDASVAHELGDFMLSGRMFWAMLSDPRVLDGLEKRGLALRGMKVTVRPGKGQRAKTLAKKYEQLRQRIWRPEVVSELLDAAIMMGQGVGQPVFRYDETGPDNPAAKSTARKWYIPRVETWEPTLTRWIPGPWLPYWQNNAPQPWMTVQGQLVAITRGSMREDYSLQVPIVPGTGQWILFKLSGDRRPWMHGRLRAIWRPWIFRLLAQLGHVRFNDVHGLPIRAIKIPFGMRKGAEGKQFEADVKVLGQSATLYLPQPDESNRPGAGMDLIEAKSESWKSFLEGRAAEGREITICLTGGTQSTEAEGGNYKGAEEQREIRHEVKAATAIAWALMENEQLVEPFATANLYDPEEAPIVEFDVTPPANQGAEAKAKQEEAKALTDSINAWLLARRAGAKGGLDKFLEQRGLSLPDGYSYGEPEMAAMQPAQAPGKEQAA